MNSKNENEFTRAVGTWPQWIDLPGDVTANILQRLEVVDILQSAEKVCTTWRRVCSDPAMWRVLHIKDDNFCDEWILNLWRRAVDRSQGQLADLSIDDFGDDNLLSYIVDRSRDLKRLTIKRFYGSGKAMAEAVSKLPHLEELCLIDSSVIEASDIVNIGNSCPVLKSFTFDQHGFTLYYPMLSYPGSLYNFIETKKYEYDVAIVKTMPELRHLRIFCNLITNEGVDAIKDGCPKLESLDILDALHKRY